MNDSPSILEEWLLRAQAGDSAARDRLFAACRNYLAIHARLQLERPLRAKVDASDLVQETLLEAHREFTRFEGRTPQAWLAWLRRILEHNATDLARAYHGTARRNVGRERALVDQETLANGPAWEPAAPDASPSAELLRRERELWLADSLARLPEESREVLILRNLQRWPWDEVARRMQRSIPAAQMLWLRAIQKLRSQVKESA